MQRLLILRHFVVKPLRNSEQIEVNPVIFTPYLGAVFYGQGDAVHESSQDAGYLMCRTAAPCLHILGDVVRVCCIDRKVIDELR